MKNFEERKAEVYRRSEEIALKRKKRTRILLFTMPILFVCVVISSVITNSILNDLSKVPESEGTHGPSYGLEDSDDTILDKENTVPGDEPNGPSHGREDSDDTVLDKGNTVLGDEPNGWTSVGNDIITIQITDAKGNIIAYALDGNTLHDMTHGTMQKLTDEQLKEIKQLFNLSDE